MRKLSTLLIALVAFAMLFVSCQEAGADKLGTVELGRSKNLAASVAIPDTANLTWKYTAEKTSGFWKTGEKLEQTEFSFGTSLGSFSTDGTWKFTVYAYNSSSVLVYKGTASGVTIVADQTNNVSIDIESQLADGKVVFGEITHSFGAVYAGNEIKLVVSDGSATAPVTYANATIDSDGNVSFAFADETSKTLSEGRYTYLYTMQTADGTADLAEGSISFLIYKGYTVTISGSLTSLEETGEVVLDEKVAKFGSTCYATLAEAAEENKGEYISLLKDNSEAIDDDTSVYLNGFKLVDSVVAEDVTLTIKVADDAILSFQGGAGSSKISVSVVDNEIVVTTEGGTLSVDAPNDTIRHYGTAELVLVNYTAPKSYHAYCAAQSIRIGYGRLVLESTAMVDSVVLRDASIENIQVDAATGAQVRNLFVDISAAGGIDTVKAHIGGDAAETLKAIVHDVDDAVASIGNAYYTSLAEAIASITDDTPTTITMVADVEGACGISVPSGMNITVDFDGHSYTVEKPGAGSTYTKTIGFQLLKDSSITFKNGTIACTSDNKDFTWASSDSIKGIAMVIQNYANLTLDAMTIDGTNIAHNGSSVRYVLSNNCGTVTVNDTTITACSGDFAFDSCFCDPYTKPSVTVSGSSVINGKVELSGGDVTLESGATVNGQVRVGENKNGGATGSTLAIKNGATVNTPGSYAIVVFGANTVDIEGKVNGIIGTNGNAYNAGSVINVKSGAEISESSSVAIYLPNGELNISGGTITGTTAVYFKSTKLSITGGTLTATGEDQSYAFNGSGCNETGDALVIDNCNYPSGASADDISISGGTFISTNASAVASYIGNGATTRLTGFITGGTFNTDPSDLVASSASAVQSGDVWTVSAN